MKKFTFLFAFCFLTVFNHLLIAQTVTVSKNTIHDFQSRTRFEMLHNTDQLKIFSTHQLSYWGTLEDATFHIIQENAKDIDFHAPSEYHHLFATYNDKKITWVSFVDTKNKKTKTIEYAIYRSLLPTDKGTSKFNFEKMATFTYKSDKEIYPFTIASEDKSKFAVIFEENKKRHVYIFDNHGNLISVEKISLDFQNDIVGNITMIKNDGTICMLSYSGELKNGNISNQQLHLLTFSEGNDEPVAISTVDVDFENIRTIKATILNDERFFIYGDYAEKGENLTGFFFCFANTDGEFVGEIKNTGGNFKKLSKTIQIDQDKEKGYASDIFLNKALIMENGNIVFIENECYKRTVTGDKVAYIEYYTRGFYCQMVSPSGELINEHFFPMPFITSSYPHARNAIFATIQDDKVVFYYPGNQENFKQGVKLLTAVSRKNVLHKQIGVKQPIPCIVHAVFDDLDYIDLKTYLFSSKNVFCQGLTLMDNKFNFIAEGYIMKVAFYYLGEISF